MTEKNDPRHTVVVGCLVCNVGEDVLLSVIGSGDGRSRRDG